MPLNIYDETSTPRPTGLQMLDNYGGHIKTLYETGSRPLTAIAGTANAVTATMAIDVTTAGYVDGLCVSLTWAAANTGGVTLAINGGSAVPVLDARGTALVAGTLAAGLRSVLMYVSGSWRIISSLGASTGGAGPQYQAFLASGTWTKPAGYDDDTLVLIECWGGGGGGASAANGPGGGGGAYVSRLMRIVDIPSSVAVTIGAGGVIAADGGASTFGSLVTARGGRTGANVGGGGGGGGGGEAGAAGAASGVTPGAGGDAGGGNGGNGSQSSGVPGGIGGRGFWGGGGGGGGSSGAGTQVGGAGGPSVYGGGGGGGVGVNGTGAGGVSLYGGAGGAGNVAGAAPGGAGGRNAAGARGECRVTIFG